MCGSRLILTHWVFCVGNVQLETGIAFYSAGTLYNFQRECNDLFQFRLGTIYWEVREYVLARNFCSNIYFVWLKAEETFF
jgi:hypothetical protein